MKSITKRILSMVFALIMVLSIVAIGGTITASATNDKTVSVQFIVDNNNKYMETFEITFSTITRESNSATIKITWKNTIFANKFDVWRYDAEVKCGNVTTGRKIVVPANTWKSGSNVARSKSASTTLKIPLSTTNETTVNLVCYEYQCDSSGNIRYTEKDKPGTVKYTIPKYNAPITTYTLSYNANGGTGAPASQTGASKYTISSQKPSRNGYTFLGWSKSNSASTADYSSGSSITLSSATTLYAVWKKIETTNIYNLGDETYSFKNYAKCTGDSCCKGTYHCYGFSVTSEAYYNNIISKKSVGANESQSVYKLSKDNEKVRSTICYYQNRQSNRTIVAGGRRYLNKKTSLTDDWTEVINYVKNHNYDNKGSLIVSFKQGRYGHAVDFLYYKEVNGQQRIYIYDSNEPGTECYLYKGSDGKIYETPHATLKNIDCVALRSLEKCISYAGDYDGSHVIYAETGEIEVEGANTVSMDCGDEYSCTLFEIPENYCDVIITPLVDNAEFTYLDEEYKFGGIDEDTYGTFILASNDDGAIGNDQNFTIENANCIDDLSIDYKSSVKLDLHANNYKSVQFESSDPNVVTVDNNGNIYGKNKGTAVITCKITDNYNNISKGTCTVTVGYAWWQWLIKIVLLGWIWY